MQRYKALTAALLVVSAIAAGVAACGGHVDDGAAATVLAANDLPETGLQGQVPIADQTSGRSTAGYRKGMTLVGQSTLMDRGGNMQLAWYRNCAYVDNGSAGNHPLEGLAVVDVSDPAKPSLVRIVSSPTGHNSWEGLEVGSATGVMVAFATSRTNPLYTTLFGADNPNNDGIAADALDVYDLSQDCRNPVRAATLGTRDLFPGGIHGLKISPDGRTAYISTIKAFAAPASQATLAAVDISVPSAPKVIATWNWNDDPENTGAEAWHDGDISDDGNTLYWGTVASFANEPVKHTGVRAFDVSSIRNRSANASFRLLGKVDWTDCGDSQGHTVQFAKINGAPYVFAGAECTGVQYHVIPVGDPAHMTVAATYTTEASDPKNAAAVANDNVTYWGHYTGVDSVANATTLFVTWYGSGLRLLDIRDPLHIKEFAYYNPPAHPNNVFCGFMCATKNEVLMSDVHYDRGSGNIWFAGVNGGFYVAHITASAGLNGLTVQ
ncbi:LVIVD repeat-containing protein [Burkholderia pseudomultivorans]|uniref:LVIVD repeat-containing protein n=1 Tax=Burkholderia pseudomultivorans TaxID=1207504 RepID=UPI0007555770|nr:hypothetical protein [Burkholderia pseudomultivorans]KVC34220.1 hypothetical protein WS55_33700 [Burkholderia pseudomultivorans]KVC42499.1 hypothetical protein WS56_31230 [Burkholderia pseudomultivorans]